MAKASLTLPNGTVVQIEGTVEEVQALLAHYGSRAARTRGSRPEKGTAAARPKGRRSEATPSPSAQAEGENGGSTPNLSEIVNLTKTCDDDIKARYRKLISELLGLAGIRK